MRLNQIALSLLAVLSVSSVVQAAPVLVGKSSDTNQVEVNQANNPSHPGGNAAISIVQAAAPYNAFTGLSALQGLAGAFTSLGTSNTPVTVGNADFTVTNIPVTALPASHSALGNFHFAQVLDVKDSSNTNNIEAFIGDWIGSGAGAASTYSVYYNVDTQYNTPITETGTVTYDILGVNGSSSGLAGTFDVDFSNEVIDGQLTGGTGPTSDLTLTSVGFDISSGEVNSALYGGSASANSGTVTGGNVDGQFFGVNGQGLVGIVDFGSLNRQYNTAFGGVKQ